MKKILLVAHNLDDFVGQDLKILRKKYEVRVITMGSAKEVVLNFFKLMNEERKCDLVFIWFGAFYAMLATIFCRIFGKKSIIVAGGHDTAHIPEIKYGLKCRPIAKHFPWIAFRLADKIIPFSEYSKFELHKHYGHAHKAETIYLGLDSALYKPSGKKENLVVTVCEVKKANIKRKGLDIFVKAAKQVRNAHFVVIGKEMDSYAEYLKRISPPNVKFTGFLKGNELLEYLRRAKVYAQLSGHEGFGYALAEAMLLECVPVVTKRGSLPEVVGNTGCYTEYGDVESAIKAIKKALRAKKGRAARKRIISKFSLKDREKRLLRIVGELIGR